MSSQCEQILEYLRQFGSITPVDALREFGCMRLGARIWDLIHKHGHLITKKMEKSVNRFGREVVYARYTLVKEADT